VGTIIPETGARIKAKTGLPQRHRDTEKSQKLNGEKAQTNAATTLGSSQVGAQPLDSAPTDLRTNRAAVRFTSSPSHRRNSTCGHSVAGGWDDGGGGECCGVIEDDAPAFGEFAEVEGEDAGGLVGFTDEMKFSDDVGGV
jgi:hypothetical protein